MFGATNPAYTHGHTAGKFSPEYYTWASMRTRCTNPNHSSFKNYGARGITVCPQWASFEQFLADMGPRPEGKTLDRIDTSGNYEPSNCRWATYSEQGSNRRTCVYATLGGVTKPLQVWAAALGISMSTVWPRIYRQKLTPEEALTRPTKRPDGKCASGFAKGDPRNPQVKRAKKP